MSGGFFRPPPSNFPAAPPGMFSPTGGGNFRGHPPGRFPCVPNQRGPNLHRPRGGGLVYIDRDNPIMGGGQGPNCMPPGFRPPHGPWNGGSPFRFPRFPGPPNAGGPRMVPPWQGGKRKHPNQPKQEVCISVRHYSMIV